jgi:putative tryptophan/tyrosine transport system substrate-binding protein
MRKNSEIIAQHLAVALILTAVLFALCSSIGAQQSTKIPRVAYLTAAPLAAMVERTNAFRQGLRELGYVEGKNILLELRSSEGRLDALRGIADELVRMKVDVIVTGGGGVTGPVRDATSTIPIVMAQDSDPVGNGFVASLARPGGNITGLSNQSSELVSKRLEILTEVIPKLSRLAIFGTSSNRDNARELKEIEKTASTFKARTLYFDVLAPTDIDIAFNSAVRARSDAVLWIVAGQIARPHRKESAQLAIRYHLPTMYTTTDYVEFGGLMNYGVDLPALDHRAATYVHKILHGAKAAELPVEQPLKFNFGVNLKTAQQIGVIIPQQVLARADKVIR